MSQSPICLRALLLATLALVGTAAAQTVGETIRFKPGDTRVRSQIMRLPRLPQELRELVAGRFDWAMVDLDGDGHRELLVLSRDGAFCGSAGCTFAGYRLAPGAVRELFGGSVDGPMALTAEQYGGMRGVVVLDANGAIQRDRQGRVHLFKVEGGTEAPAATATHSPAAAPASVPVVAPAPANGPELVGLRLGMSRADAEAVLRARQNACGKSAGLSWNKANDSAFYEGLMELSWRGCGPHGIQAFEGAKEETERVLLTAPPDQRVVGIERAVTMEKPFAHDVVFETLRTRFGREADTNRGVWLFDAEGHATSKGDTVRCVAAANEWWQGYMALLDWQLYRLRTGVSGARHDKLDPSCGRVLAVQAGEPGGISYTMRMVLMDQAAMVAAAEPAAAHVRARQQAGQQKVLDQAGKNALPKF